MRVDPSEQSKQDVLEIAQYIALSNVDAAVYFLECVEKTYDIIASFPEIGHAPIFDFVENLETVLIRDFKHYHVFYRVLGDVVRIDRVADGRRDMSSFFEYMMNC